MTDGPGRQTCIVVPCYNEAARLRGQAFLDFLELDPQVCFLFVNDGSRDSTLQVLEQLCAACPNRLFLLNLPVNGGKAEAVRRGLLRAMEELQPRFVGFWDADLATPLDAIPSFVEKLVADDALEMVFGARILLLGRQVKRRASRHYLGRAFATVASSVLRLPVYDTQCGAKLFRVNRALPRILAEPFLSRWIFDVEIIARLIQANGGDTAQVEKMIFELPLMRWEDVSGSKLRPKDFVRAAVDMIKIRNRYLV